ncbi:hypothetical protein [Lentzea sp. HUAS12]|uniref:hypothetical protein n=1 Tax=Lentzea sp. HUAS12 TaxID=2951806 RepID=UPI0020A09CB8|nr:hypothetical protein [Lentzea sp. HUAS12]USX56369.1 hypothetical protein ND450_20380 [Lentzea sp. HUAS12]
MKLWTVPAALGVAVTALISGSGVASAAYTEPDPALPPGLYKIATYMDGTACYTDAQLFLSRHMDKWRTADCVQTYPSTGSAYYYTLWARKERA